MWRMSKGRVGRVAALDFGKARVGVAVADELGLLAHPRPALDARNKKALLSALAELAKEEELSRFLVGLPLSMSGAMGAMGEKALRFAEELANATGVEVEMVDERLTTVEATRRLREGGVRAREGKKLVDGAAAAVLLQSWLDRRAGG